MRSYTIILIIVAMFFTLGCGYHVYGNATYLPAEIKYIILNSYDPHGPLTRVVCSELRLHDMTLIDDREIKNNKVSSLRIINVLEQQINRSIFQNGKTAEYQIKLTVQADFSISGQDWYPVNVDVYRSFFYNPLVGMAKSVEVDIIRQEMYNQAGYKLVKKVLSVYFLKRDSLKNGFK
ncbi:Rare lipoprotein B [secondary endosymbiont of Heteropsylla cubana]|uniref:LPS-assembly lipoprotein LptE n=1 Tax=secondary endosymbiont of Heteropsylla cubana TaxID=134287 RepID=J3VU14_9ENTR|nr:LPS assembly lipoprotein LptE [secondary endosymbiont of Heteropsylla cubana]AFP85576.1 Rare lipoprotein B [secondary endosymbiont of Heteropsylla cubana]